MFQLSGINPTVCSGDQGLNKLAMATKKAIEQLAKGVGTVLRFKLTSTLTPGGSGTAEIQEFDGGGYSRQRDGVIHDEEPGGLWEGFVGDEGWCTGRAGEQGRFSIVWMEHITTAYPEPTESANTFITNLIVNGVGSKWIKRSSGIATFGSISATMTWTGTAYDDGSGAFTASSGTITHVSTVGWYRHTLMLSGVSGTGSAGPNPAPALPEPITVNLRGPGIVPKGARSKIYYLSETQLIQTALIYVDVGSLDLYVEIDLASSYFTGISVLAGDWCLELVRAGAQ